MEKPPSIFERTYRGYLGQVAGLDLPALAGRIGAEAAGEGLILPFFGRPYRISPGGIRGPSGEEPSQAVKVILCKYLLLHPAVEPGGREWVSYKDFRDAAPFVDGFQKNTEKAIARRFSGKLEALKKACGDLGGKDPGFDWSYQMKVRFEALPRVPLILLFNDRDEEFPAHCTLLFEERAARYLDMECLAMVAWLLADGLIASLGVGGRRVL